MTLRYSLLLIRDTRILAALNIILRIFFFTNTITFLRAVTRGKTGKIAIMHGFYGIERSSSNVCSAEKLTKQSTVLLLRLVSFPAEQMLAAACQRCMPTMWPLCQYCLLARYLCKYLCSKLFQIIFLDAKTLFEKG